MSIVRDPETYEKFENVILTHTVRTIKELHIKIYYKTSIMTHTHL